MSEETIAKQNNTKTLSIVSNREDSKVHSVTVSNGFFWTMLLLICVLIGVVLGILFYESRAVMQITEEIMTQRNKYAYLEGEYNTLMLENEGLAEQVQVLSDTINKRAAEDEVAAQAAAEAKVPTGFPVTGSVTEAEAPEEDNALEMAVYFEAAVSSVVVSTAEGTVTGVRKNVYDNYEIQINHGNGYVTIYTNAGHPLMEEGVNVLKGTPLFFVEEDNTLVKYQVSLNGGLINAYDVMQIDG